MTKVSLGSTLKICCHSRLALPAFPRNKMAWILAWKRHVHSDKEGARVGAMRVIEEPFPNELLHAQWDFEVQNILQERERNSVRTCSNFKPLDNV